MSWAIYLHNHSLKNCEILVLISMLYLYLRGKKMNFKNVTDQTLDANLKSLVVSERELLSEILLHIAEVDRRRMYLHLGYPSLFEYLTKSTGYANGSAQRRIDAARLSLEVPEVIANLESGKINLAQVTLVQKSIREVQSQITGTRVKISTQIKETLLNDLANKSFSESEVLVRKTLDIKLKTAAQLKYQKDESVRLEITFSKEQWQKLNKMRELLSNSLPNGSWNQIFEYVAEKVIQQKDKARVLKKRNGNSKSELGNVNTEIGNMEVEFDNLNVEIGSVKAEPERLNTKINDMKIEPAKSNEEIESVIVEPHSLQTKSNNTINQPLKRARQHIPMSVQRSVYSRDKCCQYKNKITGKQCRSQWQLSIDHIEPVWANGSNEPENLRILCASHNREVYRQQANLTVKS